MKKVPTQEALIVRTVGTCQTIDHVGAGRAHLIAGVLGVVAVASLIGSALTELVLSRWHFGSHAYHREQAERARDEAGA